MNRSPTECQPCDAFVQHETEAPGFFVTHDCPRCGGAGVRENCGNCHRDHHRGGWNSCPSERKHCVHPACVAAEAARPTPAETKGATR